MKAKEKKLTGGNALAARAGQKTILLTDDSPILRNLYAGVLLDAGYHVLQASDAAAAQGLVRRGTDIHLLFVDFYMPGMNGMELAQWFRKDRPNSAILLVSTDEQRIDWARHRLPWLHCHVKPSSPMELVGLVEHVFDQTPPSPA